MPSTRAVGLLLVTVAAVHPAAAGEMAPKLAAPTAPPPAHAAEGGAMVRFAGGTHGAGSKQMVGPFLLDATEVTVAAYAACVKAGKCTPAPSTVDWPGIDAADRKRWSVHCNQARPDRASHPANCVDLDQATAYCAWAGKRLPTEEELEWAARGAERRTTFPWGDEEPGSQVCWNGEGTCPVGSHPGGDSPQGVKDLAGHVWEWASRKPPCGGAPDSADPDCRRWCVFDATDVAAAHRYEYVRTHRASNLGFRCAGTP